MYRMVALFLLALLPGFVVAEAPAKKALPIGWGVVTAVEADAYDRTGQAVGKLKGGDRFLVLKAITADKAPAYYIETVVKGKSLRVVVPGSATKVFMELPDPEDPKAVEGVKQVQMALSEYYATYAMRQAMMDRAREQHLARSPVGRVKACREELASIPAKDRAYEVAQSKSTSNAERLRYQDLRKELRYRATGLQNEIKRMEKEEAAWLKSHPFNEAAIRQKPVWKRLTARLNEMAGPLALYGVAPVEE